MVEHVHQCSIIGPYCAGCGMDWDKSWNPPEDPERIRSVMKMVLDDLAYTYNKTKAYYEQEIRKAEAQRGQG